MIPLLICFPFLTSNLQYTCFMPTKRFLVIVSLILMAQMLLVVVVNTIDLPDRLTLGLAFMWVFVCGTLCFITLTVAGLKGPNRPLLSAAFWVWCFTWTGYLFIIMYSMWNKDTVALMSIKGRCPLTLWLFDWCNDTASFTQISEQEKTTSVLLDRNIYKPPPGLTFKKTSEDPKGPASLAFLNVASGYMDDANTEKKTSVLLDRAFNIYKPPPGLTFKRTSDDPNAGLPFMNAARDYMDDANAAAIRKRRSMTDVGVSTYHSGKEYRVAVAHYLGVFFLLIQTIAIYTLYGMALNSITNQLRWQHPIIYIARTTQASQLVVTQNQS